MTTILGWVVGVLALLVLLFTACGSPSAAPAADYGTFDDLVATIAELEDNGRRTDVTRFWRGLADSGQIPFVRGEQVVFLYRGRADSVIWVGDFTDWQRGEPLQGQRVGDTDLWWATASFPAGARLEYRISVDGAETIPDPENPLEQWGGFGPNSVVAMPDYVFPSEVIPNDELPQGELTDPAAIHSDSLNYDVNVQVYTPAGYENLAALPAIYVTDSHEAADSRMGALPIVLDNLIAAGRIEPMLAVFIDPRDPETGENRRIDEFLDNPAYLAFIAEELVPWVDSHYSTDPQPGRRAILGVSYGAVNAAAFGLHYPDRFGWIIMQSPAFVDDQLYDAYSAADQLPLNFFLSTGYPWDYDARAFHVILQDQDYPVLYMEVPEGHSWGQWRAQYDEILVYCFPGTAE